jgi:hypothetical protein
VRRSYTERTLVTRRTLLGIGATAAGAALAGAWPQWATAAPSHLRRSSYAGRVGQRFAAGPVQLRLASVADIAGATRDRSLAGSEDAFVLAFSGPLDRALEPGTHRLSARGLGSFDLFVSPVGRPGADRRYEAVIDRSVR